MQIIEYYDTKMVQKYGSTIVYFLWNAVLCKIEFLMLFIHFPFVFDQIDEEHQTQIELEISLITTWRDTQVE